MSYHTLVQFSSASSHTMADPNGRFNASFRSCKMVMPSRLRTGASPTTPRTIPHTHSLRTRRHR